MIASVGLLSEMNLKMVFIAMKCSHGRHAGIGDYESMARGIMKMFLFKLITGGDKGGEKNTYLGNGMYTT